MLWRWSNMLRTCLCNMGTKALVVCRIQQGIVINLPTIQEVVELRPGDAKGPTWSMELLCGVDDLSIYNSFPSCKWWEGWKCNSRWSDTGRSRRWESSWLWIALKDWLNLKHRQGEWHNSVLYNLLTTMNKIMEHLNMHQIQCTQHRELCNNELVVVLPNLYK